MTEKEIIQKNIEEFSRFQDYMLEDGIGSKAYNTMYKRCVGICRGVKELLINNLYGIFNLSI